MDVDYLIIGAGASGMAFLDTILAETDATVAIVDRRAAPGGHWVDAYPFVRLHQSSAFYGVPSRPLGRDRTIPAGRNAGLPEMAGKAEILHYYQDLMENDYLPTGRVTWFPMSEHLGDGTIRNLANDETIRVEVTGKIVNAAWLGERASIPATHRRGFDVAPGVSITAPHELPDRAPEHRRFCILGAGKTAMDAVLWLLDAGVDPDRIAWVRPRDYWVFLRENVVPDAAFFAATMQGNLADLASLGTAATVRAHCEAMETAERWQRIDTDTWPTGFHAAVCSRAEIAALRTVRTVIRKGRVTRITPETLVLQGGDVATDPGTLHVDCTASGGARIGADAPAIFAANCITLLMIRPFQPLFSAALIARIEAMGLPDTDANALARAVDFHDTPAEFLAVQGAGMMNQYAWNQVPELRDWIDRCRLNAAHHLMRGLDPKDSDKMALLAQFGPLTRAAMQNLPRILAAQV
jgi:hypothetical protein